MESSPQRPGRARQRQCVAVASPPLRPTESVDCRFNQCIAGAAVVAYPAVSDYLTSREAVTLLGVKAQTLYAYASRGLVQSVPVRSGSKERYYLRSDVEKLRIRATARSGHGPAAAGALRYGEPVIASEITELTPNGHEYRGYLAADLARRCSFEQVATLLWTGTLDAAPAFWHLSQVLPELEAGFSRQILATESDQSIVQLFAAHALACEVGLLDAAPLATGRTLVRRFAGCFGYFAPYARYRAIRKGETIAAAVLKASELPVEASALRALDGALAILADYELASATFVARIAASCGANLSACIVAAIESSAGSVREHRRVESLLNGVRSIRMLRERVDAFRESGEVPPGFQPGLFAADDHRAAILLELARLGGKGRKLVEIVDEFLAIDAKGLGLYAKAPLGSVVFAQALGLPSGASPGVFLLARTAGWVAHVLEQAAGGARLRPRAEFRRRKDAHVPQIF